jgi:glutamate synthase (NADPH) small chain
MFDAWPEPGGILLYGIPNFKLSKDVLQDKLKYLEKLGVSFVGNTWVGKDVTIDDLFAQGFNAVFVGTGAGLGGKLAIPNEDLTGVYAATEFLVRGNLRPDQLPENMREPLDVGEDVVVIGGGDTSMDCVRTAVRLGAKRVSCVYRRTEAEMLGRQEEREHARQEGVDFQFLTIPLRFLGDEDGHVTGLECQQMELGEPDESGRRRPIPIPHSEFVIPADSVAIAIGYNADPIIKDAAPGVSTNRWNLVEVDPETYMTTQPGVFAGGDNVNGADLVVTALADGRRAADAIHEYLVSLTPAHLR